MAVKGTRKSKVKKLKPISTLEMEVGIANYFGVRQNIIVPNISWGFDGMHECDLFLIKRSGVAVEIEIKRTKPDFLADFKKPHGHVDKKNRITEFYYAMPDTLLEKVKELIPKDAGIIECGRFKSPPHNIRVSIIRKPKRIKGARKLTDTEQLKIARLGTMRIWSLKNKLLNFKKGK